MTPTQTWTPGHNVCTVIWRRNPVNDALEILVVRSQTTYRGRVTPWRVKFPGGGQEGPNESVEGTRDREVWQETGLAFRVSKEIWRDDSNPGHIKYGFMASYTECYGELRKERVIDINDELEPPYWAPVETLGRELFEKHQPLFMEALRRLRVL